MTSFALRNFGCRVNQAEASEWAASLIDKGWILENDAERSDYVIVNTCTLTTRADRDALKFVRRMARVHPAARLVVTGCLAERIPEEAAGWPGVWKLFPNREKERLAEVLMEQAAPGASAASDPARRFRARAFLKVQDGCDMSCSFCIIPAVRGSSRSLCLSRAAEKARNLAGCGYKEIVLSGVHLGAYGRDLESRPSLLDLVRGLEAAGDGFSLRLSSLDPRLCPPALIDHLISSPHVRPHFHFSLQHGSDRVLRAMGRPGSAAAYAAILDRLAAASPDAALGADILVGFPGESEDDFRTTEALLERSPLSAIHVFPFSPRPGTPAANLPPVAGALARKRAERLKALSRAKNLRFRERFRGRTLDGIVIRSGPEGAEILTENAIAVRAQSPARPRGEAVRVRITSVAPEETGGIIV